MEINKVISVIFSIVLAFILMYAFITFGARREFGHAAVCVASSTGILLYHLCFLGDKE